MTAIQNPVQKPATKTATFDDLIADFNKIRSLYTVDDPLEAFKLIIEEAEMVSLILEAHSKIREIFPGEKLALEVTTDPEIAGWRSLWIAIYTKLEVDEALEKLTILDDTWWLDNITTVTKSKLHINLAWESDEI
ncbi:MAG: peptidase [Oscillatoriales cyanobacterium RU_3_3]|nr:peptidase [Microcoleus sp. SU_5_6]NJL69096.1 peptidase [Microcoleus sp. SM1_3_4]NJM62458.1 peptidase [Oscillatoriales cyanobacterium RU_3_3]NJR23328.1 peptidase [Richelia sp. CSU_2_1]